MVLVYFGQIFLFFSFLINVSSLLCYSCLNMYECQNADPSAIAIETCYGVNPNCITEWYSGVFGTVPNRRYCAPSTDFDYDSQGCFTVLPDVLACNCNLDLCNDDTNAP